MAMGAVAWKIMGTGGAILAGVIATKVIDAIWAKAEGDEINPKSPNAPLAKAVAYAMITGLAVGRRQDPRHPQGGQVLREVGRATCPARDRRRARLTSRGRE